MKRKDEEISRIPNLEDAVRKKEEQIEELQGKQDALVEDLRNAREQLDNIPTRDVVSTTTLSFASK